MISREKQVALVEEENVPPEHDSIEFGLGGDWERFGERNVARFEKPITYQTIVGTVVVANDAGIGKEGPNQDKVVFFGGREIHDNRPIFARKSKPAINDPHDGIAFSVIDGFERFGHIVAQYLGLELSNFFTGQMFTAREPVVFTRRYLVKHLKKIKRKVQDGLDGRGHYGDLLNRFTEELPIKDDGGAVFSVARIHNNVLYIGNIGDVQTIVFDNRGRKKLVTRPHVSSRARNIVTRSVSLGDGTGFDSYRVRLNTGDMVIMASDGVWDNIRPDQLIRDCMGKDAQSIMRYIEELTTDKMTNGTGKKDNRSAVVLQFQEQKLEKPRRKPLGIRDRISRIFSPFR